MAHHLRIANAGVDPRQIGDWADTETAQDIRRSLDLVKATDRPSITMIAGAPGTGKTSAVRRFCEAHGENALLIQAARGEGTAWNFAHALANLWGRARPTFNCHFEAREKIANALETVGACEDHLLQHGLDNLPECNVPVTEHRKEHRMGRVPKIETDPELQAFLIARIDRLTYAQIAQEVAEHFPEPHRVGKSAIHAWFNKRRRG